MMMGIYGFIGSGKNVLSTYLDAKACEVYPKCVLRSNYKINLRQFDYIEPEGLIKLKREDYNRVDIDELYTWLESRVPMKAMNLYLGYINFQSRKRNIDLIGEAQLRSSIDMRFKDLEHITCYAMPRTPKSEEDFEYAYVTDNIQFRTFEYCTAKKYFDLYDTNEVIEPPNLEELITKVSLTSMKKIKERTEIAVKKINELGIDLPKITRDSVNGLLLEIEEPLVLSKYVYSMLKTLDSKRAFIYKSESQKTIVNSSERLHKLIDGKGGEN